MEPIVELRGVVKRFGAFTAVDGVSLALPPGQFFSLLGPSGCGKTTTLRLIAGFEQPDQGEVRIHGERANDVPPYRRNVSTVFQSYALFPHLTVAGNVEFGLRQAKVPEAEILERAADALDLVQLSGYAGRLPHLLSGGEKQRVALARSIVLRPDVLLLDEPLAALDEKLRQEMRLELKRLQRAVGITFLFVTHDQEEALTLSDRLAVMNRGHLEQVGTPEELYQRPQTRFVAGFLGGSNLLPVRIAEARDGVVHVLTAGGQRLTAPSPQAPLAPDTPVFLAVRPEALQLASGPAPPGTSLLRGRVLHTVFLGAHRKIQVEIEPGVTLTALAPTGASSAAGTAVELWWKLADGQILMD